MKLKIEEQTGSRRKKVFLDILFYSTLFYCILFYPILSYPILFYSILFYSNLNLLGHKLKETFPYVSTPE